MCMHMLGVTMFIQIHVYLVAYELKNKNKGYIWLKQHKVNLPVA